MEQSYQIDKLDMQILQELQKDARTPFLEIARRLIVSGGTIHQRVDKMKASGIIEGSKIEVNFAKLGYDVTVLVGIHLNNATDCSVIIDNLKMMKEVTEAYYTTGNHALFIKVVSKSIGEFQTFLMEKLQGLKEIRSTESYICLDTPIKRNPDIY